MYSNLATSFCQVHFRSSLYNVKMALVDRLQKVSDRLMGLPVKFGDPRYQTLVAVHPAEGNVTLKPTPKVESIPSYMASRYLATGVEIANDDVLVSGISRSYSLEFLKKSRYLLNGNQKAELIDILTSDMLSYSLVLRKLRGK